MARMILAVDDVAMKRQIPIAGLGTEYETTEASNGKEALSLLHRHYKLLSAVLPGIVMPVVDGYDVLHRFFFGLLKIGLVVSDTSATAENLIGPRNLTSNLLF